MTFNISLNKILPLAMWKAKNVQICSQEAYLPWSTVHKNAEQHIRIRKKSCIGSDIGSNAALVCFSILHPISAAGTTYWQKQILNAFPKRFRILSKIQINLDLVMSIEILSKVGWPSESTLGKQIWIIFIFSFVYPTFWQSYFLHHCANDIAATLRVITIFREKNSHKTQQI